MAGHFDSFTTAAATSGTSGTSSPNPVPLTPIIFCGPGSNLYPLCDPSSSTSTHVATSLTESLPKSLLPVANRPLIAYPLQHLVSAGIKHALVLAPANQHRAIEHALKSVRLQVPNVNQVNATAATTSSSATPYLPSVTSHKDESNIAVVNGMSSTTTASSISGASSQISANAKDKDAASSIAIRVQLLPLGPYDTLGAVDEDEDEQVIAKTAADARDDDDSDAEDDTPLFRRISRPGTAELLRWLDSIGKLQADPLVLPVDFIAPSLPLSSFLLSYYSSFAPSAPTVTSLLYERGAGESVGRDREKEAPPKLVSAYSHAHPSPLYSKDNGRDASGKTPLLSTHDLLLLAEPPSANSSSSTLDVRLSLLRSHPRAHFSTNLLDSHVYILRRDQVVPLLKVRRDLTSLREHVIPLVAKAGWQDALLDKSGWRASIKKESEARRRRLRSSGDADDDEPDTTSALAGLGAASGADTGSDSAQLMRLAFARSSLGFKGAASGGSNDLDKIRAVTMVARLTSVMPTLVPSADAPGAGGASNNSGSGNNNNNNSGNAGSGKGKGGQNAATPVVIEEERFFARANTLPTYLECNRFMLRSLAQSGANGVPLYFPLPSIVGTTGSSTVHTTAGSAAMVLTSSGVGAGAGGATSSSSTGAGLEVTAGDDAPPLPTTHEISTSAQLSPDTLYPLETPLHISDRVSLKRSLLAPYVRVSRSARISGSILMEGCVVGDGAKLENCILGPGARVAERCSLRDVDLGPGAKVKKGFEGRAEKIGKDEEDSSDEDEGEGSEGSAAGDDGESD